MNAANASNARLNVPGGGKGQGKKRAEPSIKFDDNGAEVREVENYIEPKSKENKSAVVEIN